MYAFARQASPFPRGLADLRLPNRVHLSLRPIWFFPLLPTPPRGDAVTSSSQPVNGPDWPGSFTPKDHAASQRTRALLRQCLVPICTAFPEVTDVASGLKVQRRRGEPKIKNAPGV
jgi:hypothetical protein